MKTIILMCFLLANIFQVAKCQNPAKTDRLYKTDNTVIDCKIVEILPSEVKYKKANYLDGPTYSISKSDLVLIQFANGESEVIRNSPVSKTTTPMSSPQSNVVPSTIAPMPSSQSNVVSSPTNTKRSTKKRYTSIGFNAMGSLSDENLTHVGENLNKLFRLGDGDGAISSYLGFGYNFLYSFSSAEYVDSGGSVAYTGFTLYVPIIYRMMLSRSKFYVEATVGPRYTGLTADYIYDDPRLGYEVTTSSTSSEFTVSGGANVGFAWNHIDLSLRLHSYTGAGVAVAYAWGRRD